MKRQTFNALNLSGFVALALLLGAMTSTASADHNYNVLEAKADAMYHTVRDMDHTFVRSYVRSRVFGEIMATSGQIKGKAIHLRVMAKHGTPCDWNREIRDLDRLVCKLPALVEEARFRAVKGIDPPIGECNIDEQMIVLTDLMQCMKDALYYQPVVRPPVRPAVYTPPVTRPAGWGEHGYARPRGYVDAGYRKPHRRAHNPWYDFAYGMRGPRGNGLAVTQHGLTIRGKQGFGLYLNF